jgi:hypothetical protein
MNSEMIPITNLVVSGVLVVTEKTCSIHDMQLTLKVHAWRSLKGEGAAFALSFSLHRYQ